MKAITLRHPWPFAICYMGKRIENRTWKPPKSLIGKTIAIHGGKVLTSFRETNELIRVTRELVERFGLPSGFVELKSDDVLKCHGIVATATLSGFVSESDDPWFDGTGYGWQLADVRVFERPIACKGAQGFWEVPDDITLLKGEERA